MKKKVKTLLLQVLLTVQIGFVPLLQGEQKPPEKIWEEVDGDAKVKQMLADPSRGPNLKEGRYGLFMHWGLYSSLEGKWQGKTYYGIGEWIMSRAMAGIPVADYMEVAKKFNPDKFDAKAIVQMAKDAGMRYIIITSKHHEGFAMYKSSHPFNIMDATPFRRDPLKELSEACKKEGLGFGLYYSHYQDWTSPGAHNGPTQNADGSKATFEKYFREKCYPQAKEICTNFGPLEVVWFDTPGKMPKELVVELHDLVRATQPKALLGSRIGYDLGDYQSLGDMEVPPEKVEGLWESCDTTNDSWSYVWYDTNWKTPREILHRLVSTSARGGTYLLNVGLDGTGVAPMQCQEFLKESGQWIKEHPQVIYGASSSPWRYAMPWGDITTQKDGTLNLVVFELPYDRMIYLPYLSTPVKYVSFIKSGKKIELPFKKIEKSIQIELPSDEVISMASLVEVELQGKAEVDQDLAVYPNISNRLLVHFAKVTGAEQKQVKWPEKFGERKRATQASKWTPGGKVVWDFNLLEEGAYQVALRYRGKMAEKERIVWKITTNEGVMVQNQQGVTTKYQTYPMGVLRFKNSGKQQIEVQLVEGDLKESSLESIELVKAR